MNLIVAVDKNWGIGNKDRLLVKIPSDMKFFRETTVGKVVVMGRKTLETFPNGMPLKKRTNIILSGNPSFHMKDATVVHSVEECLELLKAYNEDDIYVIGGESVYREFLPYCRLAHVTWIDYAFEADRHFPNLDEDPSWVMTGESEEQTCFDLEFYWRRYERL